MNNLPGDAHSCRTTDSCRTTNKKFIDKRLNFYQSILNCTSHFLLTKPDVRPILSAVKFCSIPLAWSACSDDSRSVQEPRYLVLWLPNSAPLFSRKKRGWSSSIHQETPSIRASNKPLPSWKHARTEKNTRLQYAQ